MGKSALTSHLTDPREIEKIKRKRVKVYSSDHLHAKVYLFDKHLIVCSGNISISSQRRLIEAGLSTTEPNAIVAANGFFKFIQLHSQKVDQAFLNLCKRIYKSAHPPVYFGDSTDGRRGDALNRWWLRNTQEVDFLGEEKIFTEREEKKRAKRGYTCTTIRYPATSRSVKEMQQGDFLVEIYTDKKGRTEVYPPIPILWKYTRTVGHLRRTYIVLEEPQYEESFKKFKAFMTAQGLLRIGKNSNQEIRNVDVQQALLGFWLKN